MSAAAAAVILAIKEQAERLLARADDFNTTDVAAFGSILTDLVVLDKYLADRSLADECERIYEKHGQFAVHDFIRTQHPEVAWAYCGPCEIESPVYDDCCLVCGSVITRLRQRHQAGHAASREEN